MSTRNSTIDDQYAELIETDEDINIHEGSYSFPRIDKCIKIKQKIIPICALTILILFMIMIMIFILYITYVYFE